LINVPCHASIGTIAKNEGYARFEMRLETTMIERVDAWRRKQEDLPSRAEAFRRLIELGLSTKKGAKVKT